MDAHKQIRAIRATTTIALEFFVHGALCVCMSGQCALSYAIGGRSDNRGQCAQPCRREYALIDGHGETIIGNRHLLSFATSILALTLPTWSTPVSRRSKSKAV